MDVYCRFDDAIFSPAEVQEITSASVLLQGTWRRRGFLGTRTHGRASFNAREVAQIIALRYLGQDLNTHLEFIREAAQVAAPKILWHALSERPGTALDVQGTVEQQAAFRRAIAAQDLFGLQYLNKMVGVKEGEAHRFLVRTESQVEFTSDLNSRFFDDHVKGAIVLDLMELGRVLADKTSRPLIIVSDIEIRGLDIAKSRLSKKRDRR